MSVDKKQYLFPNLIGYHLAWSMHGIESTASPPLERGRLLGSKSTQIKGWLEADLHAACCTHGVKVVLTTVGCSALGSLSLCHVYLKCFIVSGGAKQTGEWKLPLLKINTGEKLRSEGGQGHTWSLKEAKLHSQSMSKVFLPTGDVSEQALLKLFGFCTLHVRSEEAGLCCPQCNAAETHAPGQMGLLWCCTQVSHPLTAFYS